MKAAHTHIIEIITVEMSIKLDDLKLIVFYGLFLHEEDTS